MGVLSRPVPLQTRHDRAHFQCGEPLLDQWLTRHALRNQVSGASRTYVVCEDRRVMGYFTLANGSVARADATGGIRRNLPEPVPVVVLGRLAVDERFASQGMGSGMLRDAFLRARAAAEISAARALLVHALHERARDFYVRHGFAPAPIDPLILMHSLY